MHRALAARRSLTMRILSLVLASSLAACAAGPSTSPNTLSGDRSDDGCPLPNEMYHTLVEDGTLTTSGHRTLLPDSELSELEVKQILKGLEAPEGMSAAEAIDSLTQDSELTIATAVLETGDADAFTVYRYHAGDNPHGFIFTMESMELVAIIGDGNVECVSAPQTGLRDCEYPLTIEMEAWDADSQEAHFVLDLASGQCDFSSGFMDQYDPDDKDILSLHFFQVTGEDLDLGNGELSYTEGWREVFNSQNAGQCSTHNLCELAPDDSVLVQLDTDADERNDGYSASLLFIVRFDAELGAMTIEDLLLEEL
jgi:hypothetical protein